MSRAYGHFIQNWGITYKTVGGRKKVNVQQNIIKMSYRHVTNEEI